VFLGRQKKALQRLFPGCMTVDDIDTVNFGHATIMKAVRVYANDRTVLAKAQTI
jgi:hypothetical protein